MPKISLLDLADRTSDHSSGRRPALQRHLPKVLTPDGFNFRHRLSAPQHEPNFQSKAVQKQILSSSCPKQVKQTRGTGSSTARQTNPG